MTAPIPAWVVALHFSNRLAHDPGHIFFGAHLFRKIIFEDLQLFLLFRGKFRVWPPFAKLSIEPVAVA